MASENKVYIISQTGNYYYFSPGCSVTETYSDDSIMDFTSNAAGETILDTTGIAKKRIFRIDAQISGVDMDGGDPNKKRGVDMFPYFNRHDFVTDIMTTTTKQFHTFRWGDEVYVGFITNITVTQRPGEGSLFDVAVTFKAGEVLGVS
jgi:hypothetical protein